MTEQEYSSALSDISHIVTLLDQVWNDMDPEDLEGIAIAAQIKAACAILERAGE